MNRKVSYYQPSYIEEAKTPKAWKGGIREERKEGKKTLSLSCRALLSVFLVHPPLRPRSRARGLPPLRSLSRARGHPLAHPLTLLRPLTPQLPRHP